MTMYAVFVVKIFLFLFFIDTQRLLLLTICWVSKIFEMFVKQIWNILCCWSVCFRWYERCTMIVELIFDVLICMWMKCNGRFFLAMLSLWNWISWEMRSQRALVTDWNWRSVELHKYTLFSVQYTVRYSMSWWKAKRAPCYSMLLIQYGEQYRHTVVAQGEGNATNKICANTFRYTRTYCQYTTIIITTNTIEKPNE